LIRLPPLDPALAGTSGKNWWVRVKARLEPSNSLLLMRYPESEPMSLWTYNLATGAQTSLFETRRFGQCAVSPGGDKVFIVHQPEGGGPTDVTLLDIASSEYTPVMKVENPVKDPDDSIWSSVRSPVWNRKGDKVAFLVRQARGVFTPAVYLLKERRVIMPGNCRVKEMSYSRSMLEWMSGDAKLLFVSPEDRSLKILDPGLAVERAVPIPASIGEYFSFWATGDTVLMGGASEVRGSIWRLDLKTEKWKRIW